MAFSLRNLKIRQQIYLVAFPPLFILLSASFLAIYGYRVAMQVNQSLRDSQESLMRGESILRYLIEMYTGVREYALLHQPASLSSYQEAAGRIPEELVALRLAESENAAHVAEVQGIEADIRRWQWEWVQPTIGTVKDGKPLDRSVLSNGEKRMLALRKRMGNLFDQDKAENLAMLSTAGVPPLSGFWSKLIIILALWISGYRVYAVVAVIASVITLAYFLSMQRRVFFGKTGSEFNNVKEAGFRMSFPALILALLIVAIGILFPFLAGAYVNLTGLLGG